MRSKNISNKIEGSKATFKFLKKALPFFLLGSIFNPINILAGNVEIQGSADANSVAIGENAKTSNSGGNSVAIGPSVTVNGGDSIAIGAAWESWDSNGNGSRFVYPYTHVEGTGSIAIGSAQTYVKGDHTIALGDSAKGLGNYNEAIGMSSSIKNSSINHAVALGSESIAEENNTISIGNSNLKRRITNLNAGINATDAVNVKQLNDATLFYSFGEQYKIEDLAYTPGIHIDQTSKWNNDYRSKLNGIAAITTADQAEAIGHQASALSAYSVAVGHGAEIQENSNFSTAVGYDTYIDKESANATAIGHGATVENNANSSIAIGSMSNASESNVFSIGNDGKGAGWHQAAFTRRIVNMSDGTAGNNGATVAQTMTIQDGINTKATKKGTNNIGQTIYQIDTEGKGKVASGDTGLINGDTVYNELRPAKDGTYVRTNKTTAENLTNLDTQITNLQNGEGFTNKGKTFLQSLAQDAVTVKAGDRITIDTKKDEKGNIQYTISANNDGQIVKGDKNLVSGDTVAKTIETLSGTTDTKLAGKADINAGNIGNNLKNPDGSIASKASKKANSEAWGNAIGTGKVEKGSKELVTGDTVNTAIDKINSKIDDNKTYVDDELKKKANVDGSNIDKDKFSKAVAIGTVTKGEKRAVSGDAVNEAISNISNAVNTKLEDKANTNLDNLTENGQKVIQNLAKGSIDIVDGHNTNVSKNSVNGKDIYSIDVSDKDIIDAMKPEMDKKADKDEVNKKFGEVDKSLSNKADRDAGNLTEKDISSWQDKLGNGTIEKGNTGLINGNTAYEAIKELKDSNLVQSDGKTITIGAKDTASVVDFRNSDGKGRVLTGVVTDVNDRSSAANAGYVQDTAKALQQQMNNGYSKLNKNISKAAAGSNALAALHPLNYDPDDKANYAVGYGHYRDANAAAVGMFYYPNASTMVSIGATIGNGDTGVNAGISFKVGKGSAYNGISKADLIKQNKAVINENNEMKERLGTMEAKMEAMEKAIEKLQGSPISEIEKEPVQKTIAEPIQETAAINNADEEIKENTPQYEETIEEDNKKNDQEELDLMLRGIE